MIQYQIIRAGLVCALLLISVSSHAQQPLIYGKYTYTTEIGNSNIKFSYYTEYHLELRVDSQYILKKHIYHTSKPGLSHGFELVEFTRHRGYWKVEHDILYLKRISMVLQMKESKLIEPTWVELDIRDWAKKKGYFMFRRKPKH